jgi:hypothetical protein
VNEWIYNPAGSSLLPQWANKVSQNWTLVTLADRGRWMTTAMSVIGSRTLRDIAIPGAHDAGMYTGGPRLSTFARTQSLNIFEQLSEGVRYFDLRPTWQHEGLGDPEYELFIHHTLQGPPLKDLLDDVARFMGGAGRELVILKFSHYENFTADVYEQLVGLVQSKLASWLLTTRPAGRIANTALSSLIGANGTVLVVCDEAYPLNHPVSGFYVYRDWNKSDASRADLTVFDSYADKSDPNLVIADQRQKFSNYSGLCTDGVTPCDLFLLSWTVTPALSGDYWLVEPGAAVINPRLQEAKTFTNGHAPPLKINVIYLDYVGSSSVTRLCLDLNGL